MPFVKGNKVNLGKKYSAERIARMSQGRRGNRHAQATKDKLRQSHLGKKYPHRKRILLSENHKANIQESLREYYSFHKRKGHGQNMLTRMKISASTKGKHKPAETRRRMSQRARRGEKSNFWRGGVAQAHKTEREVLSSSVEYKIWRDAVFRRDNYTCQHCGIRGRAGLGKRIVLHADHILPFRSHPELRLEMNNGRTLCVDCHRKTDTYGNYNLRKRKRNSLGQFK